MTMDRTFPLTQRPTTIHSPGDDPGDSPSGEVLNAAQLFLEVSRAAYDDCQRGKDAVNEMQRRKNTSGQ